MGRTRGSDMRKGGWEVVCGGLRQEMVLHGRQKLIAMACRRALLTEAIGLRRKH